MPTFPSQLACFSVDTSLRVAITEGNMEKHRSPCGELAGERVLENVLAQEERARPPARQHTPLSMYARPLSRSQFPVPSLGAGVTGRASVCFSSLASVPPFVRATVSPFVWGTVSPFVRAIVSPFVQPSVPPFVWGTVSPFGRATVSPFGRATARMCRM